MGSNMQQSFEINLRDLLFVILKKIGVIMLVGIVLAGILFAYKYRPKKINSNVLDTSVRLEGETDFAYSERVLKVNRAVDIIKSINDFNTQIDAQRSYMTDSILMQIDATNEAVSSAQIFISIDNSISSGIDKALASAYSQDLLSGEYLSEYADNLGIEQGYLKELIKVDYSASNSLYVSADGKSGYTGALNITVIGTNTDITEKILNLVIEEINVKHSVLNDNMVPHKISVAGIQNFYTLDTNTRDLQYNATNRFEILQKQIITYEAALDDVASKIGVGNKENLYAYYLYDDDSWNSTSTGIKKSLVFAFVGFVLGSCLVVFIIFVDYLYGKKFATQGNFFGRFPTVTKIGIVKPNQKRSKFSALIDKKSGDDNYLSEDITYRLISGNIKNITSGMNKVLFTGTADSSKIKELVNNLAVNADFKENFFVDPDSLASLSEYDGVIIVEQRKYSDCRIIKEELSLIANSNAKLIGAIIL